MKRPHSVTIIILAVLSVGLSQRLDEFDQGANSLSINATSTQTNFNDSSNKVSCRFASLKCNYRSGCGRTLQSYLLECADLISNRTRSCSERCKNTLVGLTSTPEGVKLMDCSCDDKDEDCKAAKSRVVPACSESVLRAQMAGVNVSCSEARWICTSDSQCAKALEYYELYCKGLFKGNRCTSRCKNSIDILRRQTQAEKLESCDCRGDQSCLDVKRGIRDLCFPPPPPPPPPKIEEEDISENIIEDEKSGDSTHLRSNNVFVIVLTAVIFHIVFLP